MAAHGRLSEMLQVGLWAMTIKQASGLGIPLVHSLDRALKLWVIQKCYYISTLQAVCSVWMIVVLAAR